MNIHTLFLCFEMGLEIKDFFGQIYTLRVCVRVSFQLYIWLASQVRPPLPFLDQMKAFGTSKKEQSIWSFLASKTIHESLGWNNRNQTTLILREVSSWSSRDFVLGWRTKDTAKTRSNGWNYFNSLYGAQIKRAGSWETLRSVSKSIAYKSFDKTSFLTVAHLPKVQGPSILAWWNVSSETLQSLECAVLVFKIYLFFGCRPQLLHAGLL